MSRTSKTVLALTLTLLAAGTARADFTATAMLLGINERPTPNFSAAVGLATVTFNSLANDLTYDVTYSGLDAPATVSHIHFGGPNVAGPVILPFSPSPTGTSGEIIGTLFDASLINQGTSGITTIAGAANAILAGNAYVNIHSSVFPGGEIRGQLVPAAAAVPEPGPWALLGLGMPALLLVARRRYEAVPSGA